MSILLFILPITLLLSLAAVAAFTWATRSGQFDDLQTPALRALHDPAPPRADSLSPRAASPEGGRA
jgi:cbb3-type cytochrome oxidase maturation protein